MEIRSAKEIATIIRGELKAAGHNSRKVSVRSEHFGISDGVNIQIKDPSVSLELVKSIAEPFESVRRCEITGDILGGGNTYISITDADGFCR